MTDRRQRGSIHRWPGEESLNLYPGLVVSDGEHSRVTGSITVGRSRLPLWAFLPQTVRGGWDEAEDYYGDGDEETFGREAAVEFVADLTQLRGEFGRLLLVLADAERCETSGRTAWYLTKRHQKRVRAQLLRCVAVLDAQSEERLERIRDLEDGEKRLRDAIHEHRARVMHGARADCDLNDADEALWALAGEATP